MQSELEKREMEERQERKERCKRVSEQSKVLPYRMLYSAISQFQFDAMYGLRCSSML
jgi:hypothetical protein